MKMRFDNRQWRAAVQPMKLGGATVSESRLRNGMRVVVAERHSDPVVSTLLMYGVGSRTENESMAGVSHFLEHMMFKGTSKFGKGEVDRITTELGGHNNAFTSYDHTGYWFEMASDRWEQALEIEADRMQSLSLDPAEFDAERSVVLEELAMSEDDPWRVLTQRIQSSMFPRHSYRWPVIGYAETLKSMTVDDMRGYYDRFYHPANATLIITGDVTKAKALSLARKHFGGIEAGPEKQAEPFGLFVEPRGETRLTMNWDDAAKRLAMAWPTSPVCSDDDYTLDIVTTVLAQGRLSRLQRRLVLDEGLATNISLSNECWVNGGSFWVLAECSQDTEPMKLEAAINAELSRLSTEKMTAAELKRARSILLSAEAYDCETVSDLGDELGEYAVDADWRMAFDGGKRHGAVTSARIKECVNRLITPERRVVGWCLPK
ncbi:MAG: zinc protease [Planctomycetota bacterium]|jgi:zinc protease